MPRLLLLCISGGTVIISAAAAFFLEPIFPLGDWRWAIVVVVGCLVLWVLYRKLEKYESTPYSTETLLQLEAWKAQRRKDWMAFVGRHIMWFYLLIAFFMLWILRPLLGLNDGG